MHLATQRLLFCSLLLTLASTAASQPEPSWPHWRGPARTGLSSESGWSSQGSAQPRWTLDAGLGYSNVSIDRGRLFTMGFDAEESVDHLLCLNPETGRELWRHSWPAEVRANFHGGGTLTTPTVDGDVVFASNREGRCFALTASTGELLWEHNYTDELGLKITFHGFSASPLALHDRLILELGGTVLSVAKDTGVVHWRTADEGDGGYSNPVPFSLRGRRMLANFAGPGLIVREVETGKERYRYPWKAKGGGVNSATPVIIGDKIFISTAYNLGSALLQLGDEPTPTLLWRCRQMRNKCSGCVLYDDHIYGFDESMLCCIGLDGKRKWRMRGLGMGALTIAGGRLLVLSSKGELLVGPASGDGFSPTYRNKVLDGGVYWTSPVVLDGLVYCRSSLGKIVCLDHRGNDGGAVAQDAPNPTADPESLPKAADLFRRHVQITGGDALAEVNTATLEGTIETPDVGLTTSPLTICMGAPDDRILTIDHGRFGVGRYGFDAECAWELDQLFYQRVLDEAAHRELVETQSLRAFTDSNSEYESLTTTGRADFAGQDCWVIDAVSQRGAHRKLYFACVAGHLVGHEGDGESTVSYADWREFDGIHVATTRHAVAHDTGNEEVRRIRTVAWNTVADDLFARPAAVTRLLRTPEQIASANAAATKRFTAQLGSYTRTETPEGATRTAKITVTDGFLSFEPDRGSPLWFLPPNADGTFPGRDGPLQLRFRSDADGNVTGMTLQTGRGTYEFTRDH
ncbi:MAG: PQQ-binding-like beta-propeller repeat protein [Planctomycetota bacterium]